MTMPNGYQLDRLKRSSLLRSIATSENPSASRTDGKTNLGNVALDSRSR